MRLQNENSGDDVFSSDIETMIGRSEMIRMIRMIKIIMIVIMIGT